MKTQLKVMGWINIVIFAITALALLEEGDFNGFLVECYVVWSGVVMIQASSLVKK